MKNRIPAFILASVLAMVGLTPVPVIAGQAGGQKKPSEPVATPDEFKARVIR